MAPQAQDSGNFMSCVKNALSSLGQALGAPDNPDPKFTLSIMEALSQRLRQGAQGPGAGQPPGMGGPAGGPPMGVGQPGMGGPPMGGPPPGPPMQPGMGGGVGMMAGRPSPAGVNPLSQTPNPDELRRLIQGLQGA